MKSVIKGLIVLAIMLVGLPAAFQVINGIIFSDGVKTTSEPVSDEEYYDEHEDTVQKDLQYAFEHDPDAISYEEADEHIGDYITMYAEVADVDTESSDANPIFVDFGASYPDERVTGVIWPENQSQFEDIEDIVGEVVRVEGTLYEYDGTPNIELTDSFQIQEAE